MGGQYVQGVEGNVLATELSLTRDMLDANCGVGQSGWVWLCTRNKTYGFEKSGEDYCGNM